MDFNLGALLQSAGSVLGGDDEEISVIASPRKPTVMEPLDVRSLGNRGVLEEAGDAASNAPQRKGMFGIKGTFRDILGTVGDAFLLGSGGNTIYRDQREREKMGDAMAGMSTDAMGAAERLALS